MAGEMSNEQAQSILDATSLQAEGILGDRTQVDDILNQVKAQVADLPAAAVGALSNVPVMATMIKSYVTQEYTNVSPKVVASVLGALLYLVKGKDIIPDSIPLIGLVDDVAVVALALKINEKELEEFKQWEATGQLPSTEVQA